jgi:hypothetical protein
MKKLTRVKKIENKIYFIRGKRVMLDRDLAAVYQVTTVRLNQQVRRNLKKFPPDFMFQLAPREFERLMLQIATSKKARGGLRKRPLVFTEHGTVMAATVLSSPRATAMSVYVVRAFVQFREILSANQELAKKLSDLEGKLTSRLDVHENAILRLFAEIRDLLNPPLPPPFPEKPPIGFHP